MPQLLSLQQNYQRLQDENRMLQDKGIQQARDTALPAAA